MIKAVIFDVDGVLLDSFESNYEFHCEMMKAAGYSAPSREQYESLIHASTLDAIKAYMDISDEKEIERIWNISQAVVYEPKTTQQLPVKAKETIEKLSADYLLGIVTNRTKIYLFEEPLDSLKHFFPVAVAYEDIINHKPHPEPLLLAAKQLNVQPEECVYIGDTIVDVQAARAAGMKMILYSTNAVEGANCTTSTFADIPELVKGL